MNHKTIASKPGEVAMDEKEKPGIRLPSGRFPKGVSGNPDGMSKDKRQFMQMCRDLIEEEGPESAMEQIKRLALKSKDDRLRLEAWKVILDRAFGRPSQDVNHNGSIPIDLVISLVPDREGE